MRPVFTLYYMLQDEKVPLQHKAYIIGALGYFILPFDLIPESVLPIIGFTDDVAVMTFVLKMVKDSRYDEARELLAQARKIDLEAHKIQTKLITAEMSDSDEKPEIGLLMVHAQDHYMTSQLARDLIEEMINVFEAKEGK